METKKNCEKNINIIREIKKVQIMFEQNLTKILGKYDLTSAQAPIITYLFEAEKKHVEVQQKDLEEYFYLKNPTVTGILDRLEKKKYIIRKVSKEDKRKRIIVLTEKAKKIYEEAATCLTDFRSKALKDITKEEMEVAISMINKMSTNLENIEKK